MIPLDCCPGGHVASAHDKNQYEESTHPGLRYCGIRIARYFANHGASRRNTQWPQYSYRAIDVGKIGSRNRGEELSSITCNRTKSNGTASFATASTVTSTFSYTAGLTSEKIAGILAASASISGGWSTSTTVTETVSITTKPNKCYQVFALRDTYRYTLQKKCNYACWGAYASKQWVTQGSGTYSKAVGRAYYEV